ncbi:putative divalent cation transporter [Lyophyllum shimeji]|uniref:Divalent cation transporter n=1 Tax=Lyophyllum shimeji TaxID=47721 RepID=A0A9P3UII9_LYOSH|nr:putative divalent cation transporter [Lyophyllum shimeji]
MNSQSPGNGSLEDDIEMIGLEDVVKKPRSPPHQDGRGMHSHDFEDSDDEDEHADGRQALLGSQERSSGHVQLVSSVGRLWPQISSIVIESAPTLLFTTIGLLFTGELLDKVSRWRAMREVHQLIMIIPVVLNLKGNLEMNLSARLGTAANVGELDDPTLRRTLILGNLSLLQVQAAVVSFIAACIALVLGLALPRITPASSPSAPLNETSPGNVTIRAMYQILETGALHSRRPISIPTKDNYGSFSFARLVMVASTAMTAACLSSIVLGSFMCTLIVLCRKYGRDPDNIAPPVASCLGDLVTLCFVGVTSSILIIVINTPIPFIVGILVVVFATACLIYTIRNKHVRPLLGQGWTPLFGAMAISSGTGIVLDRFVSRYEGFALLAVVISGLPGSVGSILVSRLSTSLHAAALAVTPVSGGRNAPEPSTKLVMMTLLFVTLPVEIIFLSVLRGLGWLTLPFTFVALSIVFFFIAVLISLYVAKILTNYLWAKQRDPDMYALPIHSALMDLVGQTLLAICFEIVQLIGKTPRMRQ